MDFTVSQDLLGGLARFHVNTTKVVRVKVDKRSRYTYFMAIIFGDENISFNAFSTCNIPTRTTFFLTLKVSCSAISTARRQISRHLRASPERAATCVKKNILKAVKLTRRHFDAHFIPTG